MINIKIKTHKKDKTLHEQSIESCQVILLYSENSNKMFWLWNMGEFSRSCLKCEAYWTSCLQEWLEQSNFFIYRLPIIIARETNRRTFNFHYISRDKSRKEQNGIPRKHLQATPPKQRGICLFLPLCLESDQEFCASHWHFRFAYCS